MSGTFVIPVGRWSCCTGRGEGGLSHALLHGGIFISKMIKLKLHLNSNQPFKLTILMFLYIDLLVETIWSRP